MENRSKTYKDLIFWKKAFETARQIILLSKKLQYGLDNKIILNQLLRAVMSIGANIAEGYGRYGGKEFKRFLQISLGSANETEYWLEMLKIANPKLILQIDNLISLNREVVKMLASSIKSLSNKVK